MNYYEILELNHEATATDIKKSYRRLAMKYHPDRNDGNKAAEEKFKLINEAYITLSDTSKKQDYDYSLNHGSSHFNGENNSNMHDFYSHSFEEMFKNFGFQHGFQHNRIQTLVVNLEFWEAALGCEKTYEFTVNTASGKKRAKINVTFEPATNVGDLVPVHIENNVLHLQVNILDDLSFERDNLDIYTMLEVPFTTGVLGGKVIFPHWTKDLEIAVPAGVENGTKIRLANMGIKKSIYMGDLYLVIKLVTPKKLNKKQKELLNEFDNIENKKENSFNQSLKNLWSSLFKNKKSDEPPKE